MTNMQVCCTFTLSAMVRLLLLLENTVEGFLCAEFRTVESFPKCSVHCVNVVCSRVLMFDLKEHVNKTWRDRKTFLKWYSVDMLLACEDFLHIWCFHEHFYGETLHEDGLYPFHSQRVQNLHPGESVMRLEFCHWLHTNRQFPPLILFTEEANEINNTRNSHGWSHENPPGTVEKIFNIFALSMCDAVW
jgi:hypothetical protein